MNMIIPILLIAISGGIGIFFAMGFASVYATKRLNQAIDLIKRDEYEAARKAILHAVRMKRSLRNNLELRELYEVIVSNNRTGAKFIANRVQLNIPNWPKSKLETIYQEPSFGILLIAFVLLMIIIRVMNL